MKLVRDARGISLMVRDARGTILKIQGRKFQKQGQNLYHQGRNTGAPGPRGWIF